MTVVKCKQKYSEGFQNILAQGTFNWRAYSYPDFIQNNFLFKRMFDFFDNRDKCRNPGFLRGNTLLAFLWFF